MINILKILWQFYILDSEHLDGIITQDECHVKIIKNYKYKNINLIVKRIAGDKYNEELQLENKKQFRKINLKEVLEVRIFHDNQIEYDKKKKPLLPVGLHLNRFERLLAKLAFNRLYAKYKNFTINSIIFFINSI